jgi:hypothetical protein
METSEGAPVPGKEERQQQRFDALVNLLQDQDHPLAWETLFVSRLNVEYVGNGTVLSALEQAGILPDTKCGNPHDPRRNPQEFEQWFEDHPDNKAQFLEAKDEQEKALRYLYLGTIIGERYGKNMYPNHEYFMPRKSKRQS